jgi:hypothetical protein
MSTSSSSSATAAALASLSQPAPSAIASTLTQPVSFVLAVPPAPELNLSAPVSSSSSPVLKPLPSSLSSPQQLPPSTPNAAATVLSPSLSALPSSSTPHVAPAYSVIAKMASQIPSLSLNDEQKLDDSSLSPQSLPPNLMNFNDIMSRSSMYVSWHRFRLFSGPSMIFHV